ncbi:MAG: DMT family transporter [Owenweeksia sp.]|nr:DMT family transporter [Owenweeksia sp.]
MRCAHLRAQLYTGEGCNALLYRAARFNTTARSSEQSPFLAYCVFFKWERPVLKDHLRFFICAIFGVALDQLSFFEGLSITTPINAAVMMTVNPILVLLMAAIILKEPLRVARILGIGLGIIGALVLITRGGSQVAIFSAEKSLGNLLGICECGFLTQLTWCW